MTYDALLTEYEGKGWKIDRSSAVIVSDVGGVIKYDINVVSPNNDFGTAQVVVKNGEAYATGFWQERTETTFPERLNTYIRSMEAGDVFAITLDQIYASDSAALVTAYQGTTSVTATKFIVKERSNTFSFKPVA
jgi:hypothetical protein